MESKIETAVQRFLGGCNCAQSVLATYAPSFGLSETDALRIATGFGAGLGYLQEVCGALSGAFMSLGCCCGASKCPDPEARVATYGLVRDLGQRFAALHGSLRCGELLGFDLGTAEGQARFRDEETKERRCAVYVRDACRLLEEVLPAQGR